MSDKLFPLPIDTPISDDPKVGIKFGAIWNRFFKAFSDMAIKSTVVSNLPVTAITSPVVPTVTQVEINATARAFKVVLNGNLCLCTYAPAAALAVPVELVLPYPALLAFDIDGTVYLPTQIQPVPASPSVRSVTIPAATTYLRFWYIIQPSTT